MEKWYRKQGCEGLSLLDSYSNEIYNSIKQNDQPKHSIEVRDLRNNLQVDLTCYHFND